MAAAGPRSFQGLQALLLGISAGVALLAGAPYIERLRRRLWRLSRDLLAPVVGRRWAELALTEEPSSRKWLLRKTSEGSIADGILGAIGNTPLIRIKSLSEETGCEILGKAEFLNPGGSVKDRVALQIVTEVTRKREKKIITQYCAMVPLGGNIKDWVALHIVTEALDKGKLEPGGLITEGSAGSTGISLSLVAAALGCQCFVAMPDDAALEKSEAMQAYGTTVMRVRPVSITHPDHFVHIARRKAHEIVEASQKRREEHGDFGGEPSALFADQFENLANFRAHYNETGPEIWRQTGGKVDAFVAAAGTGGTLAGVSCYLKERNSKIKCFLIDPPGSGLYNRVTRGVMYTREEAEGKRLRNPQDTITEGIGINRLTANFLLAKLDGAFKGTDQDAVNMSRKLLRNDGLFVGSSSAMNCIGAVRVAKALGPGHTIVTILCDSGTRYLSNFFNAGFLEKNGLTLPKEDVINHIGEVSQ